MSQPFNITTPNTQSGPDSLFGSAGTKNTPDAPDGLFSALLSLLGNNSAPQLSDLVQVGTPEQTGEAWLNLQLGDASVSLSSQALTTAINPETMIGMVPGILDSLQLDDLALSGINKIAEATAPVVAPPAPVTQQSNALIALSNNLTTTPETPTIPVQNQLTSDMLKQVDTEIVSSAQSTNLTAQNNAPVSTLAKNILSFQENSGAPLTPEQMAQLNAQNPQESLAAQLQRKLGTQAEQSQIQQARANLAPGPQNAATQNTPGFSAALSQLPFVQTREVLISNEPIAVAQNTGQSASQTEQAGLFRPVQAAYQSPQINLPNMAIAITRNFNAGINRFQIRLDPAELGRVDIRLHVDENGTVNARLSVERPETLELLQRDARALERALSQAGLDSPRPNLEFSLKQNPFAGENFDDNDDMSGHDNKNSENDITDTSQNPDLAVAAYKGTVTASGVSLWV